MFRLFKFEIFFTLDEYDESYKIVIKSNIDQKENFNTILIPLKFKNVFPNNRDLIFYRID